jgi:hypothetical protein
MRSPCRSFRADAVGRVGWLLATLAVVGAAGCSSGGPELAVGVAPDRVLTGPQGTTGQFAVECGFDRFLPDDPIVMPGRAGASHLHQFFGAVDVSVDSDYDELVAGDTTCDQRADTASYWTPTLIDADGQPVAPIRSVAYYRAGPDVDPADVVAYPPGMMMIAGDHTAIDPQPVSLVAWTCGAGGTRTSEPSVCAGSTSLRMLVTFPDCWNGVDVRSPIVPEPNRHVAYSTAGECPPEHAVHIPQLQFAVDWPAPETVEGLALSSGHIHSGHADFWNTWDQAALEREVTACLHRNLPCTISG